MTDSDKHKILLVDDNYDTVETLFDRLAFEGYDVEVAYDGEECMEKLNHTHPQLIILDIMMPRMDGYEVIKKIREKKEFDDISIIVSSAKDNITDVNIVEKMNVQGYASKPYRSTELLGQIKMCLQGKLDKQTGFREAKIKSLKKQFGK